MADPALETIVESSRRLVDVQKVNQLLLWDGDVMMPSGGSSARASQRGTLEAVRFEHLRDPELATALDDVDRSSLTDEEAAIVREIQREQDIATRIPRDLFAEISAVSGRAHEKWKRAKEANDFAIWAPELQRYFELHEEKARHLDSDVEPFEALWANRLGYLAQPHIPLETIETIFDDLRDELVPLIERIEAADAAGDPDALSGDFDTDVQFRMTRELLDVLALDWNRARFDHASVGYSYGTQFDVRVTSKFNEESLLDGILTAVHEFGHTAYTHGLPDEHYGTPLGEPRGLGIHESQSHLFENHVGRSRAFWELLLPTLKEHFPQLEGLRPDDAYLAVNHVDTEDPFSFRSDELTQHLHVMIRHEIEREVVDGNLAVERIPDVYDSKARSYFGVAPETQRRGPLQSPHWSTQIPGFATYTLGSILAAQFWAALREDLPDVDQLVREGEFDPIVEWLTENVYRHGQRYRADELVRRVTGEDPTAEYFLEYAERKYGRLYDI